MENVETKECTKCGEVRPLSEYYGQWVYPKTKDPYYTYSSQCKPCRRKKSNEYRKNNLEKVKEYRDEWYKNNKHIQLENAKRWRKENRERVNKYYNDYYINNKDKFKQYRNFRSMNKTHDITKLEWESCLIYFDYSCAYCGMSENKAIELYSQTLHKEHVDHHGENDLSNCVPACKGCNSQKWEYHLSDWYNENNEIFDVERLEKILDWLYNDYIIILEGKEETS